jgi:hypothetical protein
MLHRSAVVGAAVAAFLAACDLGAVPPLNGGPDGPVGGGVDAVPGCLPTANAGADGHHNPGLSCITANCHGVPLGADAPQYSIGGTLYTSLDGTGVDGGTIVVTDGNNVTVMLTTRGLNGPGNFYSENLALVPPFTVTATRCPGLMDMGTAADSGNCNNCHNPAGTAGAKIHL